MRASDLDETARLVLMDAQPGGRLKDFAQAMEDEVPGISIAAIADLWSKYRGMDGRTRPTHDIETGRRIHT